MQQGTKFCVCRVRHMITETGSQGEAESLQLSTDWLMLLSRLDRGPRWDCQGNRRRPGPVLVLDHVHQSKLALLLHWQDADEGLVEHGPSGQLGDDLRGLRAARGRDVHLLGVPDDAVLHREERLVGSHADLVRGGENVNTHDTRWTFDSTGQELLTCAPGWYRISLWVARMLPAWTKSPGKKTHTKRC